MSKFIARNGLCSISLSASETLMVSDFGDQTEFNLNQSEIWRFPSHQINRIQVVAREDLSYIPSPHVALIQEIFSARGVESGICVDIGAYDGLNHSNTLELFKAGWRGLAVESQGDRFARLSEAYRHFQAADLARQHVKPSSVVSLLQSYDIPPEFDLLSLDIDSYDYHVLAALLESYHPTLICAEVNEVIPPPLKFAVHYAPDFELDLEERFFGQSLAMLAELAQRHGYHVLHMRYQDVFLIDARAAVGQPEPLTDIYRRGVIEQPRPDYYGKYPFDVETLWQAEPESALKLIQTGWQAYQGKFELSL